MLSKVLEDDLAARMLAGESYNRLRAEVLMALRRALARVVDAPASTDDRQIVIPRSAYKEVEG